MACHMVSSSAEPAFLTSPEGRIVAWNDAATRLLSHKAERVVGEPCYRVMEGLDVFGNRFCDQDCALRTMARRGESVHSLFLGLRKAKRGPTVFVLVIPIVVPIEGHSGRGILHVLVTRGGEPFRKGSPANRGHDVTGEETSPLFAETPTGVSKVPLTPREREVLRLLAEGVKTVEIAERLFISRATVRNHVQRIMRKLNADNRLGAVLTALRDHLI